MSWTSTGTRFLRIAPEIPSRPVRGEAPYVGHIKTTRGEDGEVSPLVHEHERP